MLYENGSKINIAVPNSRIFHAVVQAWKAEWLLLSLITTAGVVIWHLSCDIADGMLTSDWYYFIDIHKAFRVAFCCRCFSGIYSAMNNKKVEGIFRQLYNF